MNKEEIPTIIEAIEFREDQEYLKVQIWRRSYDTAPPPMEPHHPYHDIIVNDPRYKYGPAKTLFPFTESLRLTLERTIPYWECTIIPEMRRGNRVIIAAHGNSLRALIKHIDKVSNEEIMALNLPTGIPFEYIFDKKMKPVVSMKFLGDEETVKKAMEEVANQGKKKPNVKKAMEEVANQGKKKPK